MKIFSKLIILISTLILIFLSNCQGIRDNLSLKKKANTDEFLVQKKNPLILPPNYDELPKPLKNKDEVNNIEEQNTEIDFSKIFQKSNQVGSSTNSITSKSLEDSIRKKIGNN